MSYDINLRDPVTKEVVMFDAKHQIKGSTYIIGGTTKANLTITYNYSTLFTELFGVNGIRFIYGKTGAESIPLLQKAINELGNNSDPNYWMPVEGNVKRALYGLLAFAELRPDGIWSGD